VALNLDLAQTVALGPFNPYIITPEWLARTEIQPGGEAEFRVKVIGEGTAFQIQQVGWEVDLRRLVVSSLEKDCGDLVAKVLRELRHTPVRAVGNNFHFTGGVEDWGQSPLPTLGQKTKTELGDVTSFDQARWAGMFHRGGARIEVTVVAGDEQFAVLFNHHRQTDPRDVEKAMAAAQQFRHDKEVSEQLLRSLLSQEIKR
jgi:hypothetical protein